MKVHRLEPGERFCQRYRVEGLLGQGAMGSVYRVLDETTGEARALKVMSPDLSSAPDFVRRFLLEATVGERIADPHVVRVFDTGVDDKTSLPYFTMELLEGEDLAHKLDRGGELDPLVARSLLRQLFETIAAAHAAMVVHRDLKPENLYVVEGSEGPLLKVLDFGVAKVVRESTMSGTKPGLGTPLWTAPEQGREGQTIRPSADVWALGLITYRLLAGKMYWRAAAQEKANVFDLAVEMLREPIEKASVRSRQIGARDLGPAFDAWLARCLDRDPLARFENAGAAFEGLVPIMSAVQGPGERQPPARDASPERTRWWLWAAAAIALAAVAALVAFVVRR